MTWWRSMSVTCLLRVYSSSWSWCRGRRTNEICSNTSFIPRQSMRYLRWKHKLLHICCSQPTSDFPSSNNLILVALTIVKYQIVNLCLSVLKHFWNASVARRNGLGIYFGNWFELYMRYTKLVLCTEIWSLRISYWTRKVSRWWSISECLQGSMKRRCLNQRVGLLSTAGEILKCDTLFSHRYPILLPSLLLHCTVSPLILASLLLTLSPSLTTSLL